MPTSTKYTYTISIDTANGLVDSDRLELDIDGSSLVTGLDYIETASDVLDVWMKDALSAPDQTTLTNVVAAHTGAALTVPPHQRQIKPLIGGMKTDIDGVFLSGTASQHVRADYSMPEDLHLQGAKVRWKNASLGDIGWLAVIHPSSQGSPAVQANSAQADVDVGASLAPYYDPANGARYMEFWNAADDTIIEVVKILSRAGNVVTLASNLAETHPITENIKARYDGFSPVRGTHGLDGGMRLLSNGVENFHNNLGITNKISTGLIVSVRMILTSDVSTRDMTVNYKFRVPLP